MVCMACGQLLQPEERTHLSPELWAVVEYSELLTWPLLGSLVLMMVMFLCTFLQDPGLKASFLLAQCRAQVVSIRRDSREDVSGRVSVHLVRL